MKIKLKPCPFCGGEAQLKRHSRGMGGVPTAILDTWAVECSACKGATDTYKSKIYQDNDGTVVVGQNGAEAAADMWNKRKTEGDLQ